MKPCSRKGDGQIALFRESHRAQMSVSRRIYCLDWTQPGRDPPTREVFKSALSWQTEQEEAGLRKQLFRLEGIIEGSCPRKRHHLLEVVAAGFIAEFLKRVIHI